uniref:THO complex subunit 5 homolog n=1 Tax=Diabrotica virgifera virgifera TaxID=50390 RepID=A0A6P7GLF6_DIAVI
MVKETTTSIKKKRKVSNPEHEGDNDIYKKVANFEEKESLNSQASLEANVYFELCEDIRNLLAKAMSLRQKHKKSNEIKDIHAEIVVKMCMVKKLNRTDKIRHVHGKETLTTEKQKCDSIKLTYQNLVYERHHLVTETNKCLAFRSKDEDIELVPFEEFMREAPESLSSKFSSYDPDDREQQHSLRLARLEWELTQRKNLAQLCKAFLEQKKKLSEDLLLRKDKLTALTPLLVNVINATKPLQDHLEMSPSGLRVEHKLAYLLPDPLYIFYVNVVSYKVVYDINLDVEIIGDEEEANRWKDLKIGMGFANDDESDTPETEQDAAEIEEVVEIKKRRHRRSVQQIDPMEEKRKKLLESHPLQVQIVAKLKDGPLLTIKFSYLIKLKIITVMSSTNCSACKITGNSAREVLTGENLLSELVEDDNGLESPNPITKFQIKKIGLTSFQSLVPQIGYAYHWAQRVCGRDFLNKKMDSDELGRTNVEIIMKIIFKRLESRYQLATQLQQLEQNTIPTMPKPADCPVSFTCSISKWIAISYQKYCQLEFTKTFLEEELVAPSDLFYSLQISRGSASLEAFIVIKSNYPSTLPIISVCVNYNGVHHSENDDEIRDMERLLNVSVREALSPSVLSLQIVRLCSYFDVYLETTNPKEFPQTVTFVKSVSARNRRRPFIYRKVGNGIFTQY